MQYAKMIRIVGIGDIEISKNPDDSIITHALSSCVAVIVYCRVSKVAGMIHVALPRKPHNTLPQSMKQGYYADEGMDILLTRLREYGCLDKTTYEIHIVGGANPSSSNDFFKIGIRNLEIVKQILKSRNLPYKELAVGGNLSRTVEINVADGSISVKSQPLII